MNALNRRLNQIIFSRRAVMSWSLAMGGLAGLIMAIEPLLSAWQAWYSQTDFYVDGSRWFLLLSVVVGISAGLGIAWQKRDGQLWQLFSASAAMGIFLGIAGAFLGDMLWLMNQARHYATPTYFFLTHLGLYAQDEGFFYAVAASISLLSGFLSLAVVSPQSKNPRNLSGLLTLSGLIFVLVSAALLAPYLVERLYHESSTTAYYPFPPAWSLLLNALAAGGVLILLAVAIFSYYRQQFRLKPLLQLLQFTTIVVALAFVVNVGLITAASAHFAHQSGYSVWRYVTQAISSNGEGLAPWLVLLFITALGYQIGKKMRFSENQTETSGQFGSARWADKTYFNHADFYNPQGIPFGYDDDNRPLYWPLTNKLTLAPPGGGKTIGSSIPVLLKHTGPVFVWDAKGELWAVTARYRHQVLGRQVVLLDPFGVARTPDFTKNKADYPELLKQYRINFFDWIPEDQKQRDRMINVFASSFIVSGDGGTARHFEENAKILIRGYIDYIMTLPAAHRSLATLFDLMSEDADKAKATFARMSKQPGRAGAAANQINRVGDDERGSILSTSYRQIDWMSDSNIKATLSESNFDLRDFLKGNMDIFVLLPSDQVAEHNRFVRMLLALVMGLIAQANPGELPKEKMLFLLEELAQLDYCPDVEQCVEILRNRGVVVWTVFQTLSQINKFEKPDLFTGAQMKQVFTNDDTKTMEWIQALGGKKTVLTKTLSANSGDSRQKMQTFGGTVSSGEGESVHETGVDLIPINEIRELPKDRQFVFIHSNKAIRARKAYYFDQAEFKGKYDGNPVEKKG